MTNPPQHVLVLGAGYAGLMAAMRLAAITPPTVTITLVNAADWFNERVRNHQVAAGQPVGRVPLNRFLNRTRIRLVVGRVVALAPAHRRVQLAGAAGPQTLTYDYLVYALGSHIAPDPLPGGEAHAYTLNEASAEALAQRLPALAARQGRVLVIGGGNTGVEAATELAETYPGLRVTLVTRRSFAPQLSAGAQRHMRRAFERLHIEFCEHTAVTALQAGAALTADGRSLPFEACLWVGGFAVSALARQAGLPVNAAGQIIVDRAQRSLAFPEVFAVGDAAYPAEAPGAPVRMSLYSAIMMGAHGADCVAAALAGRAPAAFGLSYIALGVSLGRRDGVAQFLDWHADTPLNLILTGRLANQFREFFVRFAVWIIQAQRLAPWLFYWPGKGKMRRQAVAARPSPVVLTEPGRR